MSTQQSGSSQTEGQRSPSLQKTMSGIVDKVRDAISPSRKGDREGRDVGGDHESERRGRATHPTTSGRGGAGNFVERSLSPRTATKSEEELKKEREKSGSRSRSRGFGVGGAGNFKKNVSGNPELDAVEEEKKVKEVYEQAEREKHLASSTGRGGAGNLHKE
ncbi:hypothetical protein BT69DRAFT_1353157 [Atractiella rhizophila]|nr:hypothetical protein BT69DRAFT_1353157 [Atractiella rhizophila]